VRRVAVIAVVLAGAVILAALGAVAIDRLTAAWQDGAGSSAEDEISEPPPLQGSTAEVQTRPPDGIPDDAEPAIVDRVVDGDTVRVVAEPGGSIPEGGSVRVRLLNIDTPELATDEAPAECGAEAAAARLAELVAPGDVVWLAGDREDRDVYDRPLRGVWTDDGVFVNELLAREGFAETLIIGPNDRFHAVIAAAVEQAQAAGRGIWGELCPR
jgi:micrococcal nuclease